MKKLPLLHNGANFVEEDENTYLVGVGKSPIREEDVQAQVTAIKEAQLLAQKAILEFTHGTELTVQEELVKTTKTTQLVINGNLVSNDKIRTKKYEKIIKELGSGILVNLKKLGKWKENNTYFFAYFIKIP